MNKISFLVAAVLVFAVSSANATAVVLNDIQNQTVDGQDFTFDFNGVPASDGSGGTLILHAQGDYDGADFETLTWDIDGIVNSGGPVGGFVNGAGGLGGPFDFVNLFQPLGNIEFQRTYTLSAADLSAILLDGMISIFVNLADDVGLFNPPNYVEVTLSYNSREVPEPASMALLGLGLAGAGALRRRGLSA